MDENPPLDWVIMEHLKTLLEATPFLRDQDDTYEMVVINSGARRNIEDAWRANVVFIADGVEDRVQGEDEGGFFGDESPEAEDIELHALRLQIDIRHGKATQRDMSEAIAQVRQHCLTRRAWRDAGLADGVRYVREVGTLSIPPVEATSDDYLHVAITVQIGYAFDGGDPRTFVL